MTPENKKYKSDLAAIRNYPINKDEMFTQKEPLFPVMALRECYEKYIQEYGSERASVSHLLYYLLSQSKTDEQVEKEMFARFVYGDIEDIKFGVWLGNNGWQPYDGQDRWVNIHIKMGNAVAPITELFAEYKKSNPTP